MEARVAAADGARMNALLVDDERLARTELRRLLAGASGLSRSSARPRTPTKPKRASSELPVDLLFLDIKMPGASGFDLLERLERVPLLVFTTAYDEFALRAFEVNACDYLLKPILPIGWPPRSTRCGDLSRRVRRRPRAVRAPVRVRVGHRPRVSPRRRSLLDRRRWRRSRCFEGEGNYAARPLRREPPAHPHVAQRARSAARPRALLPREPQAPDQPAVRRAHRCWEGRRRRRVHGHTARRSLHRRVAPAVAQATGPSGAIERFSKARSVNARPDRANGTRDRHEKLDMKRMKG